MLLAQHSQTFVKGLLQFRFNLYFFDAQLFFDLCLGRLIFRLDFLQNLLFVHRALFDFWDGRQRIISAQACGSERRADIRQRTQRRTAAGRSGMQGPADRRRVGIRV